MQVASRQLFLIELYHFAALNSFLTDALELLLAAVYPDDLVGADKLFDFVKPFQNRFVVGHNYIPFS